MDYAIGDIVLVYKGRSNHFFEVHHVDENGIVWITDGHIQTKLIPDNTRLICKAEQRMDDRVPFVPFFN